MKEGAKHLNVYVWMRPVLLRQKTKLRLWGAVLAVMCETAALILYVVNRAPLAAKQG